MDEADIADQKVRALIRYISIKSIPAASKFMGMFLLVYAAWFLYDFVLSGNITERWTTFIGTMIIIICGTLILLDFSFNINRSIGLYAIAIGGNRIFKMSNYLTMNGPNELMTAVIFIFALVMIGISVNLIITGSVFLRGETRGRVSMIFSSGLMTAVTIVAIVIVSQTSEVTIIDVITTYPEYLIMLIMYLVLICMLETETVRMSCRDEHYISILNGIRKIDSSSEQAFIYRKEAKILCEAFTDRTSWRIVDDDGPVEAEFAFKLYNRSDDRSYVTVQKWKGEDELFFTISDHDGGSLFNAYRFACNSIMPNGSLDTFDRLTVYGDNTQMQLRVRDEPVKKRWGVRD